MAGDMRALLCLWLVAQAAQVAQVARVAVSSRVRVRRELGPGLYQHGVYDAGGSYCQRGDVCCHGRDDGCTVPYHDTLCYCDLFCNRTVSDCCPDFWEYCLGIPAPFPKAPGEAAGAGVQPWGAAAAAAARGDGCGAAITAELLRIPQSFQNSYSVQSGDGLPQKELWEQPVTPQPVPISACRQSRDTRGHEGTPPQLARSRLGQADAGPGLTLPAAGGTGSPQLPAQGSLTSPSSGAEPAPGHNRPLYPLSRQAEHI